MFFKRDELKDLLNDLKKHAERDKELLDLLKGVYRLSTKTTEEVMRPRVDVIMVSEDDTLMDLVEKFKEHRYSKYPVLSSEGDRIVGVAHIKDVFFHMNEDLSAVPVSRIRRDALFVPGAQSCYRTLKSMQQERVSMGMVVDEYGSVIGIVTIEDLLEEIVGEIYEEHDLKEEKYEPLEDGSFLVNARISISELEEILGVDLGETESTSVAGLIIEKFGGLPKEGDVVKVNGLEMEVKEVTPQRILSVVVRRVGGEG